MGSVLKIRDKNGKFVDIPAIKGDDGKSAYEQAKEGGYSGTEEEFIALLNGLTASEDASHYANLNNPHKVTPGQIGALPNGLLTNGLISTSFDTGLIFELITSNGLMQIIKDVVLKNNEYVDYGTKIIDFADSYEFSKWLGIRLSHKSAKISLLDALWLDIASGDVTKSYRIYGEHNKPTQTYTGNGADQIIHIGGIGMVAWIVSSDGLQGFVSKNGFMGMNGNQEVANQHHNFISFENGVLNLKNGALCNVDGCQYTCQVL